MKSYESLELSFEDAQIQTTTTTEVDSFVQSTESLAEVGENLSSGILALGGLVFVAVAINTKIRAGAK